MKLFANLIILVLFYAIPAHSDSKDEKLDRYNFDKLAILFPKGPTFSAQIYFTLYKKGADWKILFFNGSELTASEAVGELGPKLQKRNGVLLVPYPQHAIFFPKPYLGVFQIFAKEAQTPDFIKTTAQALNYATAGLFDRFQYLPPSESRLDITRQKGAFEKNNIQVIHESDLPNKTVETNIVEIEKKPERGIASDTSSIDLRPQVLNLTDTVIAGEAALILTPRFPTNEEALAKLLLPSKIELSVRPFPFNMELERTLPFDAIKISTLRESSYSIDLKKIKSRMQSQAWQGRTYRKKTWTISIPTPDLPSLQLEFSLNENREKNKDAVLRPVQTLRDIEIHLFLNPNELVPWKKKRRISAGILKSLGDYRIPYQVDSHADQYYRDYETSLTGNPYRIQITGRASEPQGTFQIALTEVQITGLLPRTLRIRKTNALSYVPSVHNLGWEYAFDLFQVQGLSVNEEKALIQKGGRYLVIRSGDPTADGRQQPHTISLWNEAGVETVLGTVETEQP